MSRETYYGAAMRGGSRARIDDAAALALLEQDHVSNIGAAIAAQEDDPAVHVVVRMFDRQFAPGSGDLVEPGGLTVVASRVGLRSLNRQALAGY